MMQTTCTEKITQRYTVDKHSNRTVKKSADPSSPRGSHYETITAIQLKIKSRNCPFNQVMQQILTKKSV